ncbi:Hypothetical protein CINCED_3A010081 [Cinara cedri]|uniref:Charged multivesicular body protein 7 n=1 Tax=Cinara cedri TaxID=506608 RepID=A0A5E4NBN8_9HEMI|nr:Hypothetical protein CINCED_3A010081 [Cinara cedri]
MSNKKWFDDLSDQRLAVLMGPFKNREVNEVNYDNKMKFWKNAIIAECSRRHRCLFSVGELKTWFVFKGRSPVCLLVVVEDMFREGTIKSRSNFEQMTSENNSAWSTWAMNTLVKSPLSWSVGRIKESILSPTTVVDEISEYVILHLVEDQANKLFNMISMNDQSQIFFMDDLQTRLCEIYNDNIAMTSTELIVHSLEIRNKVFVERGEHLVANKILVKVASSGKNVEPLSELEKNFFKLKETEKILIDEINKMDIEKESLTKEAKNYIAKNMKPIALTYLRKKKEIEKRVAKQLNSLDNVQSLISRIEESKYNSEVLKSYAHGLAALKLTAKDTGLTIDNVDETMAELAEVINNLS